MQKAKQAVQDFVSHDGKHKTTVHEDSRKAVTDEHVLPQQHENITTAVDKEVHQDHHHTTVQPIKAKEVLPEQHAHNILPVEHKTFDHGNDRDVRDTLDRDAAQYKDSSVTHGTTHTASAAPVVAGERTHHHVHEHVQPVIQKETIAPRVVHTTVPVHETHQASAVHHGTSVLPTETLESFKSGNKGTLDGRAATKVGEFDGPPKSYNNSLQSEALDGDRNTHNTRSSNLTDGQINDHTHSHNGAAGDGIGSNGAGTHATKPSLMDKLNPKKDADGDGKAGFMK